MDYWLHRLEVGQNLSYLLVERGILTIGFSDVASHQNILTAERDDLKKILSDTYGWTGQSLGQNAGVLFRFLHVFKVGDFVVVPKDNANYFGIFEILETAKCIYELPPNKLKNLNAALIVGQGIKFGNQFLDIGFFIKVRAVTNYDSSPFVPCENKFLFPFLCNKGQLTNVSLNVL